MSKGPQPPENLELTRELDLRRAESFLLHRKVTLEGLRLLRDGQLVRGSSAPVASVLLLHIWAVECRPCIDEFPILGRIINSLRDLPHAKAVLVTETVELAQIQRFFAEHRADLPRVDHYQSTDGRLRASLQNHAQPATLLLDARYVVRQAFLGSLKNRRSEFADALQRFSRTF